MTFIEVVQQDERSVRQFRLGHTLTVFVIVLGLLYGLNIRNGIIFATQPYNNIQVGIRMEYPRNWLIDTSGDYVFRIRDMNRVGYKTTFQIALRPAGADVSARNIIDNLTISRAPTLSTYDVQSIEAYRLPNNVEGTMMTYTFVDTEINKFLETVPVVVIGRDIIVRRGEQALVITFRSDSNTFDQDLAIFNRMLRSLEF